MSVADRRSLPFPGVSPGLNVRDRAGVWANCRAGIGTTDQGAKIEGDACASGIAPPDRACMLPRWLPASGRRAAERWGEDLGTGRQAWARLGSDIRNPKPRRQGATRRAAINHRAACERSPAGLGWGYSLMPQDGGGWEGKHRRSFAGKQRGASSSARAGGLLLISESQGARARG